MTDARAERVAVLGLGIMGRAMARRLVQAGLQVNVWNRSEGPAEELVRAGAHRAGSPAGACRDVDVVLTMLADGPATREVMLGGEGLAAMQRGAIWLQMGTVGVDWTARFARAAADAAVTFHDAPVLGTKTPAEQGTLLVLGSGPEEARERVEPVLEAVAQRTLWLGGAGAGSRMKLVVNRWIAGIVGNLAETLALARALEVPPERFLEAIDGGPVGVPYAQIKGQAMLAGDYEPSFPLKHMLKDLGLVLEAAAPSGQKLPLAAMLVEVFAEAERQGLGERDMAALYAALRGTG